MRPFFSYAAEHWATHLELGVMDHTMLDIGRKLADDLTGAWRTWFIFELRRQILCRELARGCYTRVFPHMGDILVFCARHGHVRTLQALLDKSYKPPFKEEAKNLALQIAADAGVMASSKVLIDSGVNVSVTTRELELSPLSLALR